MGLGQTFGRVNDHGLIENHRDIIGRTYGRKFMVIVGVQDKFGMESGPGGWVTQRAPRGPQAGAPDR